MLNVECLMFSGIIIKMFFLDQAPPHFHIDYGDYKAIIDIKTQEIIDVSLPIKRLKLVQA